VREDYSATGDAWSYFTHEEALSRAYRWGEDGIAGFGDDELKWCLSLALWNGNDPIIKERLFGLTNAEGNHGEDVKELYFYLDATPSHSYLRMLYKYPQARFPYEELRHENARRTTQDPEYEILDTGVFAQNRYFDVTVEYAKAASDDILMRITVTNQAAEGVLYQGVSGPGVAVTPKSVPFAEAFKKKFGNYPSYAGYTAYDEVYYIADAVKRAGSTDADKLVAALETTDWEGTIGRVQFYGKDDPFTHSIKYGKGLITGLMLQWQGGKQSAVWPKEVAKVDIKFPSFIKLSN
jgi:hypothetical protein